MTNFWEEYNAERATAARKRGIKRQQNMPRRVEFDEDDNGCWICTSHKPNASGYPAVSNGTGYSPLLLSTIARMSDPTKIGSVTRHTCDVKMCINPEHLLGGSVADNNRDALERGRLGSFTKLTAQQAYGIYYSCESMTALTKKYEVSMGAVYNIKCGLNWRAVTGAV